MHFTEARLPGVWRIGLEKREDSRGFFARVFCEQEFAAHGLITRYPQCNVVQRRNAALCAACTFSVLRSPR